MLVANHYVRVNGQVYTAGEILPDTLSETEIAWLTSEKCGAATVIETPANMETAAEPEKEFKAEEPAAEEAEEPAGNETAIEEPEEIDAMSGIVEPENKPKGRKRK